MLTRKIRLACVFSGAGLMTTIVAAQAGGMAGFHMPRSVNVGSVSNRFSGMNGHNFGSSHPLNVAGSGITNNINRSININVNKKLTVYNPVNITSRLQST